MIGKTFTHPVNQRQAKIVNIIGSIAIIKYLDDDKISAISLQNINQTSIS
jgi:hypothetical protein